MDDLQLIEGLKTGDGACLKFFYKRYAPDVKRYVLYNSGDEDDAKDLFQNAILALIDNLKRDRYVHKNNFKGYFTRMATNMWKDELDKRKTKKNKIPVITDEPEVNDKPFEIYNSVITLGEYMEQALKKIGDRCREVIIASVYTKMRMEKIAEVLGFPSAQSVRQKKLMCIKQLREIIPYEDIMGLI